MKMQSSAQKPAPPQNPCIRHRSPRTAFVRSSCISSKGHAQIKARMLWTGDMPLQGFENLPLGQVGRLHKYVVVEDHGKVQS